LVLRIFKFYAVNTSVRLQFWQGALSISVAVRPVFSGCYVFNGNWLD
jgi:hypothetical protein